jgi:WD40 repeat protein
LESHSNTTKFSRQGDYFVSGGSDKVVNLWKTGFYDSLKEKINGSDNTINANRKKVVPNAQQEVRKVEDENSQESERFDLNVL